MRIVAVSDIHLGRSSSRAQEARALRPLFDGADLAVINGDGVDFGWMPHGEALRWHEELVSCLREVAGEVVWVRGNHDLHVNGPIFHREVDLVFTHGHALFDVPPDADSYEEAFEATYEEHLQRHSTHRHGSLSKLADRIVQRVVPVGLASRMEIGRPEDANLSLLLEAAGEAVRTVVIGHLHVTGIVPRPDLVLYVTGGWTGRAPTSAFVQDNGGTSLHRVVPFGSEFVLGEEIPAPMGAIPSVRMS